MSDKEYERHQTLDGSYVYSRNRPEREAQPIDEAGPEKDAPYFRRAAEAMRQIKEAGIKIYAADLDAAKEKMEARAAELEEERVPVAAMEAWVTRMSKTYHVADLEITMDPCNWWFEVLAPFQFRMIAGGKHLPTVLEMAEQALKGVCWYRGPVHESGEYWWARTDEMGSDDPEMWAPGIVSLEKGQVFDNPNVWLKYLRPRAEDLVPPKRPEWAKGYKEEDS